MVRQPKNLKRSISRLQVSGLCLNSAGTTEINEEYGQQAGSPQETIHYRLETHTPAGMRGEGMEARRREKG